MNATRSLDNSEACYGDTSVPVLHVTLLGDEWGSSAGGLSTINRELAIHLSNHSAVKISLLVPEGACNTEEIKEAGGYGVTIVEAKKRTAYDRLDWLTIPPQDHFMDIVVGHGVKLGRQVQFIKDSTQFSNCKWIQVVHTAPEDLSSFKSYSDPISKGETKHESEVELCKLADLIVPVGPRLKEAYSSYLQRCKTDQDVLSVTPGLFQKEFGDLVAKRHPNEDGEFKVLLFGRGDDEDFELKGYKIAAQAFTDQRLKNKSYRLIFVGAPEGKQEEVRKKLLQSGILEAQLTVRKFTQSRERLKDLLCEADLAIMPSKSEGFGLVALEALSAGLPILVGSRSGFAKALEIVPLGHTCIMNSDDPAEWAKSIEAVRIRHGMRLQEIKLLRVLYGEMYSWKEQCDALVNRMQRMGYDASDIPKDVSVNEKQPVGKTHASASGFSREQCPVEEPKTEDAARLSEESPSICHTPSISGLTSDQETANTVKMSITTHYLSSELEDVVDGMLRQQLKVYLEYNKKNKLSTANGLSDFIKHLENTYNFTLTSVGVGSLVIKGQCPDLQSLESLWNDYCSGFLNEAAERFLVTDDMKKEINLVTLRLKTIIEEESYFTCKKALMEKSAISRSVSPSTESDQEAASPLIDTSPDDSKLKMELSDEEKRWIVVGIAMNKVAAPVLRDAVKQGMDTNYADLKSYCRRRLTPHCTLKTLSHKQVHIDSILSWLKFENINNNYQLLGENCESYNFNILNGSIDLAKLYLPFEVANQFSAFDESMDMTPILHLLEFRHYRPPWMFSRRTQALAKDVKDNVRNKWGHFNGTEWTDVLFNDCFDKLKNLVKSLPLEPSGKQKTLDQLDDWQRKGWQLIIEHTVDKNLLRLVKDGVTNLKSQLKQQKKQIVKVKNDVTEIKRSCTIRDQASCREARLDQRHERLDALEKELQQTGNVLKRLVSFEEQISMQLQAVEEGLVKTGEEVKLPKQGHIETVAKVDQLEQRQTKQADEVELLKRSQSETFAKVEEFTPKIQSENPPSGRDSFEEMKVEITAIEERLDASTSTGRENSDQELKTGAVTSQEDFTEDITRFPAGTSLPTLGIERKLRDVVTKTIEFEAKHRECVRALPYSDGGHAKVHFYVSSQFYSGNSGVPQKLRAAAQECFREMEVELHWFDLINDATKILNIAPVECSSGKPKRLNESQVNDINETIRNNLHVLVRHRNITAVQASLKITNSKQMTQPCITIYVLRKGFIPDGEFPLPLRLGDYPVDVVDGFWLRMNPARKPWLPKEAQKQDNVLRLGASIGVKGVEASGSLGAIVETHGKFYALSCNHVMKDPLETEIIHPGLNDYLNYLYFNLKEYKISIRNMIKSETIPTLETTFAFKDLETESQLSEKFQELKSIEEQHFDPNRKTEEFETRKENLEKTLEEGFSRKPRVIGSYVAGVSRNVTWTDEKEYFIDAAIAELTADEVRELKKHPSTQVIGTTYIPSGECSQSFKALGELCKSGRTTGFTDGGRHEDPAEVFLRSVFYEVSPENSQLVNVLKKVVLCANCVRRSGVEERLQPSENLDCDSCRKDTQVLREWLWMKNCLLISPPSDVFQTTEFAKLGDSGSLLFEVDRNEKLLGFGINFGVLANNYFIATTASPLQVALETLSRQLPGEANLRLL